MARTKKSLKLLLYSLLTLLLCSCSVQSAGVTPAQEQPTLPQTTQELVSLQPGPLAGTNFFLPQYPYRADIQQILDRQPNLVDGMDEAILNVYWANLTSLFAEDYLSPQMVVDRWRVASFGSPDIGDARLQFREHFNVEIVLDASGSMAGKIGDKTKMELAKEAIKEFAASLPAGATVSLRVYGHRGSNANEDKERSCSSSELVYTFQTYDPQKLDAALSQFAPTGWTPIANSLLLAGQDLAGFDASKNTNIIYLVSDGIETCDGNPVAVAKELSESQMMPLLNVIGFDVNAEGQKQLKEIARASQGLYANVTNKEQFARELERAREIAAKWEKWKQDALTEADAVLVDRSKWIGHYDRDWYEKNWRESLNLGAAIDYLAASGKIGKQARDYFTHERQAREAFVQASKEELTDYLVHLTKESYEEMRKDIEQKYSVID